jgi:lipopolysaccharide transport system permease protein
VRAADFVARGRLVTSLERAAPATPERLAKEKSGGQAPGRSFQRWREITYMLVLRDWQARTRQAYLGYLWLVVQPLLMTGAFSFLVQRVLGRGDQSEVPYPLFLLAALVPWQFFSNSLTDSAESLVKNVDLVRQVYFPREILAIYPIFARLIDVLVGCVVIAAFMLYFRIAPSGWLVLLPLILVEEMILAAALGLLLSAANVAWRDVSRGLPLLLFLLLYAVPVLYAFDSVPASIRPVYGMNPMAHLVDNFRAAILGTHQPDLLALAAVGVFSIVVLVAAQRIFSVFDGVLADIV